MTSPVKTQYVLNVMLSQCQSFVVGITKKKGPQFLREKLTFPGGKLEANESLFEAAAREMLEETGVQTKPEDWALFEVFHAKDYVLHKLVCISPLVFSAHQREEEPVWHLAVARHLEYAQRDPHLYAPDFVRTLTAALKHVNAPALHAALPVKEAA